ncbi:another transcription unit [Rhodnius prolixus]
MAPFKRYRGDSSEEESDGGSGSDSSDSGQSANSGSVQEEVAPTPGRTYEESDSEEAQASSKSASNSPVSHKSDSPAPSRRSHSRSRSHEKSESPVSARSRSSSYEKSASPKSNKSKQSSPKSVYSRSPASSVRSARSQSPKDSVRSQKTVSPSNSHASRSREISNSPRSSKGSGSARHSPQSASARSRSRSQSRSRSGSSNRSERSNRSNTSKGSANRYDSAKSAGSNSPGSQASRSRSPSPVVNGVKVPSDAGSDEEASDSRKRIRSVSDESQASNKEDNEGSNDEDEIEERRKKPAKINDSGSGSSGDEKSKDPATAEALFGDADDITSEEEEEEVKTKKSEGSDVEEVEETVARKSDEEEERKSDGEKEREETEKEEVIPETRIDVEIPRIVCDIGRDLHFVKLPNFLSVDTRPFSAETYEDEIDEEETLDEEGRARLKLKVENTIRWREAFDKDGIPTKESNARMVRWSDGSMSLHLGSEIFDVYKQLLQGDHNHLFIRQGTGLQGQAVFRTKLTFRPHSTESFTHRKMTLSLADRSQKSTGIKVLSQVGHDPDQHRGEMIKKEEERLRATLRRENKAKRTRERGAGRPLNTPYLEPDREDGSDDEGAISLNAIKNKYQAKNDRKQNIYSSDDEGSDLEARRPRRSDKVRALQDSDEDDEGRSGRNSEASDES